MGKSLKALLYEIEKILNNKLIDIKNDNENIKSKIDELSSEISELKSLVDGYPKETHQELIKMLERIKILESTLMKITIVLILSLISIIGVNIKPLINLLVK
jgi:hypothetical protein